MAGGQQGVNKPVNVRTQCRVVTDIVCSVASPEAVHLAWTVPKTDDIAGYHVERAAVEVYSESEIHRLKKDTLPLPNPSAGGVKRIGGFERLTAKPLTTTEFHDTQVDLSTPQPVSEPLAQENWFADRQIDVGGKPSAVVSQLRAWDPGISHLSDERSSGQWSRSEGRPPYIETCRWHKFHGRRGRQVDPAVLDCCCRCLGARRFSVIANVAQSAMEGILSTVCGTLAPIAPA